MSSEEENDFKSVLSAMMASIGKCCSERDLRRVYQEEEGHDIDSKIRKFGEVSLLSFVRNKCRSICYVLDDNGFVKIVRLTNEKSNHMDYMTKSQNKKKAMAKRKQNSNFNLIQRRVPVQSAYPNNMNQRVASSGNRPNIEIPKVPLKVVNKIQVVLKNEESIKVPVRVQIDIVDKPSKTVPIKSDPDSSASESSTDNASDCIDSIAISEDFINCYNYVIPNPLLIKFSTKVTFETKLVGISPSDFWIQHNETNFEILTKTMTRYYAQNVQRSEVNEVELKPGLIVAAKVGESFHRAEIMDKPDLNGKFGKVMVHFVDIGTCGAIPTTDVRLLHKAFGYESVKALQAEIAGVVPIGSDWSEEAKTVFLDVIEDETFTATIRDHDRENEVFVVEIENLAELLIDRGFAKRALIKGKSFAVPASTI